MNLQELNFELPEHLIAQKPTTPAHDANLMVLSKESGEIQKDTFFSITDYLQKGDILVFNNSKVIPSRIFGTTPNRGDVEVVLLKDCGAYWTALIDASNSPLNKTLVFEHGLEGVVHAKDDQEFHITFNQDSLELIKTLEVIGELPTPPYIKRKVKEKEYQNFFADKDKKGSAATPTAGLHFTPELMTKLKEHDIQIEFVTLHVGLGTFQPIFEEDIQNHTIHSEYFEVDEKTLQRISQAKKEGRRIVAVGTTSCRVLESIQAEIILPQGPVAKETSIYIFPGYTFKVTDALITNFHTPHSSLLALVMAFAGKEKIRSAYQHAIDEQWKFFSLGDGMLIQ